MTLRHLETASPQVQKGALDLPPGQVAFSLVVPCYNVGRYIDDFLQSLSDQTMGLDAVQIILVDDGSTDDTSQKGQSWVRRHSANAEYVYQKNGGIAAARNAGLRRARGEWVSFPDPDDVLAPDYLERVSANIAAFGARNVAMVACKFVRFYEATGVTADDHVLTYRFAQGVTAQRLADMSFIQLQVATAFFRRAKISEWELWFDPAIRPGFEDGHFVNRYLVRCPGDQLAVFAADALYSYRKRATGDSLHDTASASPEFWTSQPRQGWFDLLQDSRRQLGHVPPFVARTILYDVKGHLKILLDKDRSESVPPDLQSSFEQTLDEIIPQLGADAIRKGAPALRYRYQFGLLNRYSLGPMNRSPMNVVDWQRVDRLAKIEWLWASREVAFSAVVDDQPSPWMDAEVREQRLFGSTFYYAHAAWVRVTGRLRILNRRGKAVRLRGCEEAQDARSIAAEELDRWTPPSRDDAGEIRRPDLGTPSH